MMTVRHEPCETCPFRKGAHPDEATRLLKRLGGVEGGWRCPEASKADLCGGFEAYRNPDWRTIPGFTRYEASPDGRIKMKDGGRILTAERAKGVQSVRVRDDVRGWHDYHSLAELVALAYPER